MSKLFDLSRKIRIFPILAIIILSACQESAAGQITLSSEKNALDVMVVAHRSCWRLAPENSLAAMEQCIELGVDMLEIDVGKTRDDQLVVIHDKTLDRTTEHTGLVADHTLTELMNFRLREGAGGAGSTVTGFYVPSLEQVLSRLKGRVLINLDVKGSIREATINAVKDARMLDQVIIKAVAGAPDAPVIANAPYLKDVQFMPIIKDKNGGLVQQIASFHVMGPMAFEVIYSKEQDL